MSTKLHYIFDPLCGWCYAASPLVAALDEHFGDELEWIFHPGLLFSEPSTMEKPYRELIITADKRIAEMTGLTFGDAYINRVQTAPLLRYDSNLPSAAVMAVHTLNPKMGLRMLEEIQLCHYHKGGDVSDLATIKALVLTLGLDVNMFTDALKNVQQLLPGIASETRHLMRATGGNGFPTFVLECDGEYQKINHASAYGKPLVFVDSVKDLIGK